MTEFWNVLFGLLGVLFLFVGVRRFYSEAKWAKLTGGLYIGVGVLYFVQALFRDLLPFELLILFLPIGFSFNMGKNKKGS